MSNVLLEAIDLCKSYEFSDGRKSDVLCGINLKVNSGEFVSIMGASGSGKSTLLYGISGMDRISSGKVLYNNKNISDMSDEEISKIRLLNMGFVFQKSCLLKDLTIRENIMLPGIKAAKLNKTEVRKEADRLMDLVGIKKIAESDINQVSGGQLQRAAICRALINKPEMLFCDEPTGALNSSSTIEVMNILNEIHKNGTSIVVVTHDAKVASRAERIIYLSDGNIKDEYTLSKWSQSEKNDEKREYDILQWLQKNKF
ncbi:MAG: ABC transporter ATP-binding protein [Acutalibacteraceae bacterium]|nr:ABC transporter ATP-binding protein [Acutalibacteraceae bacterium]